MGLLDEVLDKAAPGGNLTTPLMVALGALLVHHVMSGGSGGSSSSQQSQSSPSIEPGQTGSASEANGGLLGGIGGLLNKLEQSGQGNAGKSWVGSGPNKQISPQQLGQALGPKNVSAAAHQAGMNEQQLLQQLAQNLPGIVDKLTANGKVPSLQQLASAFLLPK